MSISITTRYEGNRGASNVGKYVARSLGRQASVVSDQALRSEDNHKRAAQALADKLFADGIVTAKEVADVKLVDTEDDGRHIWEVGK